MTLNVKCKLITEYPRRIHHLVIRTITPIKAVMYSLSLPFYYKSTQQYSRK